MANAPDEFHIAIQPEATEVVEVHSIRTIPVLEVMGLGAGEYEYWSSSVTAPTHAVVMQLLTTILSKPCSGLVKERVRGADVDIIADMRAEFP